MFKPAPGAGGQRAGPRPRRGAWACRATAARPGRTSSARASSTRTARDHVQGRQVRRAALDSTRRRFPNGPTYFERVPRPARGLQGPVQGQGRGHQLGDRDPGRPDDRLPPEDSRSAASTTSRSCRRPLPVPQAKDTGAKYKEHVVSSGPYKFETYEAGKGFTLVRNPNWDPATDPNRKALPDKYEVAAQRQRRRHRQPAASPATSTSTSRAPACSRPRWAGSSATRR